MRLDDTVAQWQSLAADESRTRALLAQILIASTPLIRQFFRQILAGDSLSELEDLVNRTLERISRKLHTYEPSRSTFNSWLKYQCVRPVFKQHLTEIGYRTIRLEPYIACLEERLRGEKRPATHIMHRLVDGLNTGEARAELMQMRQLLEKGRLVILRRDPRRVTYSLNLPAIENTVHEEELIGSVAGQPRCGEDLLRSSLQRGLAHLNERERTAIVGVYFLERSRREIAEEVGVSAARLGQVIRQALQRLREVLGEEFAHYLAD
jgi:RNA polymerase sigma factor FliA